MSYVEYKKWKKIKEQTFKFRKSEGKKIFCKQKPNYLKNNFISKLNYLKKCFVNFIIQT
jgi:hypothetical protein